jgi:hypothetical protein
MAFLIVLPAILSLLILAAHIWFHSGDWLLTLGSLLLCGLLLFRKWWTLYIIQTVLALAAIDWLFTTYELIRRRQMQGQGWGRAAAILFGVAVFNMGAAALLRLRKASQE